MNIATRDAALQMPSAALPTQLDVGIVHDWLPTIGGAERVVQQMVATFGATTLYTLFDFLTADERRELLGEVTVQTSRLNAWPGVLRYYRALLLHCTRAIEELDVRQHQVVLSSSAALAKGVLTTPDQIHICYMHSPARYAWDMSHDYIKGMSGPLGWVKRRIAQEMMHRFRLWDMRSTPQIDHLIANSRFVQRRIWKTYRREATVIHPPVDTTAFQLSDVPRDDFFFTASRMVPYKRMDLIVAAFAERPDLQLVVAGDGPEMARIRSLAGSNIRFLGHAPRSAVIDHMQRARAFVFAAKEDFGIVPVEAQACGTPIIAFGQGGAVETVKGLGASSPTGVHFYRQDLSSLLQAVSAFEEVEADLSSAAISAHAQQFSPDCFRRSLSAFVAGVL